MRSRIVWFVAGSAAGVYTTVKTRRAAYRLSAPGVVDQAGALGAGWRELSAEVRDGMRAREQQIAHRLMTSPPPQESLDEATRAPLHPERTDPNPPDMRHP